MKFSNFWYYNNIWFLYHLSKFKVNTLFLIFFVFLFLIARSEMFFFFFSRKRQIQTSSSAQTVHHTRPIWRQTLVQRLVSIYNKTWFYAIVIWHNIHSYRFTANARNVQSAESFTEKSQRLEARSAKPEENVSSTSSLHPRNH